MNFDGKAFVKNTTARIFVSSNDRAFVRDAKSNNFCYLTRDTSNSFVIPQHNTNENVLKSKDKLYINSLIPYTVQVYKEKEKEQELESSKIIIRDARIHETQDFYYLPKKIYLSSLQPTNIKYNPKTAIVYDSEEKESVLSFAGTTVNVNSKIEVIIPDKTSNYTDMSLIVQKNSFIEIKMLDNVSDVINLPEDLIYLPGYIKGTFTKSGEYNIKIKYPDGEQILNIIVPYYQRML